MPAIRALACGLVLGCAFGASATAHAQTPSTLTCSASATRLPVGGIEPAKVSADPCAARAKTTASLTTGLLALLPVRIDALNASTSADDGALADASVARVRIGLPGFAIEARMLTARSRARCVSGATSLDTSGAIGELSINGEAIAVGSEPLVVPLGLTTLRVNYETLTATGARRQALALESLLGPVVVGEAVTGLRGTPCTPPADPKPHSEITKSIGDSRTDEATAQPGDEVTYRMRYANTGAVTASNVVVRDVLDRQAYVACEPACDHADGVVSWSLGDVEPRGTRDLVLRATLPSAQPAAATLAFRNVVTATDQVETVESDDVRVSVTYAPKLVVTHEQREQLNEGNPGEYTTQPLAWDAPTILDGRAGFGYRLHVRNEGSAPAANLVLSDRTADAYEQPECQATPGGGCDELSITCGPCALAPAGDAHEIRVQRASLPIGEELQIIYGGRLPERTYAAAETVLRTSPTVTYDGGSAPVEPLTATLATPPAAYPSLELTADRNGDGVFGYDEAVFDGGEMRGGTAAQLFVGVYNHGSSGLHDVTVRATLPPELVVLGDPCAQADDPCAYDAAARRLTLTRDALAPRETSGTLVSLRGAATTVNRTATLTAELLSAETSFDTTLGFTLTR